MKAFSSDRSGSMAVTAAASMSLLVALSALAADLGSIHLERRTLQGAADLAALAAAADPANAETRARSVLVANGFGAADMVVTTGRFTADPAIAVSERFQSGTGAVDAVRVEARQSARLYFARAFMAEAPVMGVAATAARERSVSFSLGSRLTRLEGGLGNVLLEALVGAELSLSAVGHDALLSARTDLGTLAGAVAALTGQGTTLGELLDREIEIGALIGVLGRSAQQSGEGTAAGALAGLQRDTARLRTVVRLGDIVGAEGFRTVRVEDLSRLAELDLSLAGLLAASLEKVGERRGDAVAARQSVPGLTSLVVEAMIGEGTTHRTLPSIAIGDVGTVARTAQVRARLSATVGGSGALAGTELGIPAEIVLAGGEARVREIRCAPDPRDRSVVIDVVTGVGRMEITELRGPLREASLEGSRRMATVARVRTPSLLGVSIPILEIDWGLSLRLGSDRPESAVLTGGDVARGETRTIGSRRLLSSALGDRNAVRGPNVRLLGALPLPLDRYLSDTLRLLHPAVALLDGVVDDVLRAAGVGLGEMDLRVEAIHCAAPRLVG